MILSEQPKKKGQLLMTKKTMEMTERYFPFLGLVFVSSFSLLLEKKNFRWICSIYFKFWQVCDFLKVQPLFFSLGTNSESLNRKRPFLVALVGSFLLIPKWIFLICACRRVATQTLSIDADFKLGSPLKTEGKRCRSDSRSHHLDAAIAKVNEYINTKSDNGKSLISLFLPPRLLALCNIVGFLHCRLRPNCTWLSFQEKKKDCLTNCGFRNFCLKS